MKTILGALNAIPGVIGSLVFDAADQCVADLIPAPYEPLLIQGVLAEARGVGGMLTTLDPAPWSVMTFRFESGSVFVRSADTFTLVVLAQPSLNPAMLNVGFNVATLKLAKLGREGATSSSVSSQPGQPPAPAPTAMSNSAPMGISQQVSGFSRSQSGAVPPPDGLPSGVMDSVLKALARQVGPFAKIYIKEDLAKLGASVWTLGRSQYDDFVRLVALRVPDTGKRRTFVEEVSRLVSR